MIFDEADILAMLQKQFYPKLWIFKDSSIIFYLSQHTEKQKFFCHSSHFHFTIRLSQKKKEVGTFLVESII